MIDPSNITNYNRTDKELEEFLLFCIFTAGKKATEAATKLEKFLCLLDPFRHEDDHSYFCPIIRLIQENRGTAKIEELLREARTGKYNLLTRAIDDIANVIWCGTTLNELSVEDLEMVTGIGPKTARFFLLHSRPKVRAAVLDVHILKWLKQFYPDTPKQTPHAKYYGKHEKRFLKLAKRKFKGKTIAEIDLDIWKSYSKVGA